MLKKKVENPFVNMKNLHVLVSQPPQHEIICMKLVILLKHNTGTAADPSKVLAFLHPQSLSKIAAALTSPRQKYRLGGLCKEEEVARQACHANTAEPGDRPCSPWSQALRTPPNLL